MEKNNCKKNLCGNSCNCKKNKCKRKPCNPNFGITVDTQHIIHSVVPEFDYTKIPSDAVDIMNNNNVHPTAITVIHGYVPSQIKEVYGIDPILNRATGNKQIIALINAYGYPNAFSDLTTFCKQFNLSTPHLVTSLNPLPNPPPGTFNFMIKQMASNLQTDQGWSLEQALDIQWSHAIAPDASILLVQAVNSSFNALLSAVSYAVSVGATVISMSWGASEFSGESFFDSYFNINKNIVFLAAAGDSPGVIYPSASPYVLSVGGTTLTVKNTLGIYSRNTETVWFTNSSESTGCGTSLYENKVYQNNIPFAKRTTPDVAMDADPATGVAVYDSLYSSWLQVGGTSLSSPMWAGIIAISNQRRAALNKVPLSNKTFAQGVYNTLPHPTVYNSCFYDITVGSVGTLKASVGYDPVSGLGSPSMNGLLSYLDTL
jgi:subtilase family serine protease